MKSLAVIVLALVCAVSLARGQSVYEKFFTENTLRVDLYHNGTKGEEHYSFDQAFREGPWPGHHTKLIDTLNLGDYLLCVSDRATNSLLYSRGYSTMFNEWQTTDDAMAGVYRTFSESVRFPYPRRAVRLAISRRDKRMEFHEIFSMTLDPSDPAKIIKRPHHGVFSVVPVMVNGAPAEKVDILVLGDGYAKADMEKFKKDVEHLTDVMFHTHPFKERKEDFNVWRIDVVSGESGIDIPGKNIWRRNTLGTRYDTFGSARYVLTEENKTLRDIASEAPYDFICILINDTRYGGGGIFNLYATTYTNEQLPAQQWQSDYMYVHEFGHSFAGLADEYYTSSTAYNDFYIPGVEPWEPNVTALTDPANLKWKEFLTPGIAIPTPWEKVVYDSIEAIRGKLDRLAPDYYDRREPLQKAEREVLRTSRYAGSVGAFEGAGYASRGLYRPSVDCRMFSLSLVDFDRVCSAAVERMIDFYSEPMKK